MSNTTPATEHAVIKTGYGEMTISFWPDVAPKTVDNFKETRPRRVLSYGRTAFHRIIKGFMIQGGCPNTKQGAGGIPGTGDPGYKVKAEFNSEAAHSRCDLDGALISSGFSRLPVLHLPRRRAFPRSPVHGVW